MALTSTMKNAPYTTVAMIVRQVEVGQEPGR